MTGRLDRFSMMSVLIVDDNQVNIDLLRTLLSIEGMHRLAAETDPRRVAALLPTINPDLVLLDLHMPHLHGHEVLAQITRFAAGSYLPVLVLTADIASHARDHAFESGARDFLSKPLDVNEVVLRIANLLETRQLYGALRSTVGVPDSPEPMGSSTRSRIETVLKDKMITPVFQPVIDLNTAKPVGHEALARFPEAHERGPAGWFADAFQVGLGVELEALAISQALPFLDTTSPETFLALNMSPASILHLRSKDICSRPLCSRIVIELTEHVPIENYSALHDALQEMRYYGARLAADDLGSGYAGFRHLIGLEPDIIKLDISLVSGIQHSRGARALAAALVAFAADMGAIVIAEGVEEALELEELQEIGVPWAQGYYLGRPQSAGRLVGVA
jgi:EAL domain-containing protein (putative c-di-GMP-specific phosphodiesterase class I)/DNA-binding NarL/FixJ family response regulator